MELKTQDWFKAIPNRHSRRRYLPQPLAADVTSALIHTCKNFRPFPQSRTVLVTDFTDDIFSGAVGSYGKIKGAQAYVAFIGDQSDPDIEAKVGYTGEGIVLDATAMGLATCWVAGFFRPEVVSTQIDLLENERVYAVTPVGYTAQKWALEEKIVTGFAKGRTRKSLEEIGGNFSEKTWPAWAIEGLKAARLAPSAVNRQPWRFKYEEGAVTVFTDNHDTYKISKALDCGIAMLHFELGAKKSGVSGGWEFRQSPEVACFRAK